MCVLELSDELDDVMLHQTQAEKQLKAILLLLDEPTLWTSHIQ